MTHHNLKSEILRAVAVYLLTLGVDEQPFCVAIDVGDDRWKFNCRLWPATPPNPHTKNGTASSATRASPLPVLQPPAPSNCQCLWFSPVEQKIVDHLQHGEWRATRAIAEAISEEPDGDLRVILRNLVERGVLESLTSKGFRLRL